MASHPGAIEHLLRSDRGNEDKGSVYDGACLAFRQGRLKSTTGTAETTRGVVQRPQAHQGMKVFMNDIGRPMLEFMRDRSVCM